MSLEQAVIDNTAAVRDLITLLRSGTGPVIAGAGAEPKVAAQVDAAINAANKPSAPPATANKITYDDVKKISLELVNVCGREELVKTLHEVQAGATKAPELVPENWAKHVEACQKKIAAKKGAA
jgi:hypothetical protein